MRVYVAVCGLVLFACNFCINRSALLAKCVKITFGFCRWLTPIAYMCMYFIHQLQIIGLFIMHQVMYVFQHCISYIARIFINNGANLPLMSKKIRPIYIHLHYYQFQSQKSSSSFVCVRFSHLVYMCHRSYTFLCVIAFTTQ